MRTWTRVLSVFVALALAAGVALATISTETFRSSYTGNGSTTAFATGFKFFANSHVVVVSRVTATGVETTQVEGTDYTLTGAGVDAGGTVTMTVAPASTVTLVIYRDTPLTQTTDIPVGGPLPATAIEDELDRLVMRAQEVAGDTAKALHYPVTDATTITAVLPNSATRASKFLSFDGTGAPIAAAGTSADLTPVSAFINTLLDDVDAATARATLGVAEILTTANTFTAAQIISLATAGNNLTATTTDAGATGVTIRGYHNSASPAAGDAVLKLTGDGRDTTPADVTYGDLRVNVRDVTLGGEDAEWSIRTRTGGVLTEIVRIGSDGNNVPGVRVGSPTGGYKGAGTINVDSGYYEDGIIASGNITDRTLDLVLDSDGDSLAFYDAGEGQVNEVTLRRMSSEGWLETQSASASASLDFALDGYLECRSFRFELDHILPATDAVDLWLRVSTDGGATFNAGVSDYGYAVYAFTSTNLDGFDGDAADSEIQLNGSSNIGNVAGEGFSGEMYVYNPSAAANPRFTWNGIYKSELALLNTVMNSAGERLTAQDTTDVRFLMSSGNIASGTITLYCVRS